MRKERETLGEQEGETEGLEGRDKSGPNSGSYEELGKKDLSGANPRIEMVSDNRTGLYPVTGRDSE